MIAASRRWAEHLQPGGPRSEQTVARLHDRADHDGLLEAARTLGDIEPE